MKVKAYEEEISDFEDELKRIKPEDRKKRIKKCHFCEKLHDKKSMGHLKNLYRCKSCEEANIVKKIRKIKYQDRQCNYCGKKFLIKYFNARGNTEIKSRISRCDECREKKVPKGPLPGPPFTYGECDLCGMSFTKKATLYNHMDQHRSDVCCKVCGAKFTARSALRGHLRTHFEKFICELCGFTTNVSAAFRMHNKIHAGIPIQRNDRYIKKPAKRGEFPCAICGLVYETKAGLFGHEKRQHSEKGVNGYTCKVCGHVTYRRSECRIHALTHSTRPILFCHFDGCNIFYDRLKALNTHIRNVHSNRCYTCENCNKTFKYKASVDKHLKNNRCVPLRDRNVGRSKDLISRSLRKIETKTPEELERIAEIAKKQYLEVRGSSKVFEKEELSECDEDIFNEENKIEETIIKQEEKNDNEEELNESHDHLQDCLDISPISYEDKKDVIKIQDENSNSNGNSVDSPFVKIEIKTEPDIDSSINTVVKDHWSFLHTKSEHIKSDPELIDDTMITLPNPFVLLERLDYDTIFKWIKIKMEEPIQNKHVQKKRVHKKRTEKLVGFIQKRQTVRKSKFGRTSKPKYIDNDDFYWPGFNYCESNERYECDVCGYKTKFKMKLKNHLNRHRDRFSKYQCKYCPCVFPKLVDLKKHLRFIHKITQEYQSKDFICDLCGKDFYTYQTLKVHLKFTHTTVRLQCHVCEMQFKAKNNLERHISDVHEKIFRYPCSYCGKFFKRQQALKRHELRHSSIKEQCKICGKMVKLMFEHIRVVHNRDKSKIKRVSCPECGKSMAKYSLQAHIDRAHLKILCEGRKMRHCLKCDQTFTRVEDLRRHDISEHYEGMIKKCPYEGCDGVFKKTKPLNVHIKHCHVKSQIHVCNVCGKSYATRSGMMKHQKRKGHKPVETFSLEASE